MEPSDESNDLDRRIKEATLRRLTAEADEAQGRLRTPRLLQPAYLTIMVALFSALLAAGNFFYTTRKVATLAEVDERFKKEREASLKQLGTLLGNRDEKVVASAAIQLAIVHGKASIPIFEECLNKALADNDRLVAVSALRGLSFLKDDAAKADASLIAAKVLDLPKPFMSDEDNQVLRQFALETLAMLGTPRAKERVLEEFRSRIPLANGIVSWNDPELDISNWDKLRAAVDAFEALGVLLREHPDPPMLQEVREALHAKSAGNATSGEIRATLIIRLMALDTLAKLRELGPVDEMLSDADLPMRLRAAEWNACLRKGVGLHPRIRQDIKNRIPGSAWLPPASPGQVRRGVAQFLYEPPLSELRKVMPEYDAFFRKLNGSSPFQNRYLALALARDRQFICEYVAYYPEISSVCTREDSGKAADPGGGSHQD